MLDIYRMYQSLIFGPSSHGYMHPLFFRQSNAKSAAIEKVTRVKVHASSFFLITSVKGECTLGLKVKKRVTDAKRWIESPFLFFGISFQIFLDFATRSTSRNDLLAGIDEFLSASSLLPPAQWEHTSRIEPPPEPPSQVRFDWLKLGEVTRTIS